MRIRKTDLEEISKNRPQDYLDIIYSLANGQDNTFIYISDENYTKLLTRYRPGIGTTGTELKKLIAWFPIRNKNSCPSCKALEHKMNLWGPEVCSERREYILKRLQVTALRKGIPFSKRLVNLLLDKAIKNSQWNGS